MALQYCGLIPFSPLTTCFTYWANFLKTELWSVKSLFSSNFPAFYVRFSTCSILGLFLFQEGMGGKKILAAFTANLAEFVDITATK